MRDLTDASVTIEETDHGVDRVAVDASSLSVGQCVRAEYHNHQLQSETATGTVTSVVRESEDTFIVELSTKDSETVTLSTERLSPTQHVQKGYGYSATFEKPS